MPVAPDREPDERQLALLVSTATEYAIFMLDPTGHILTWNPGAARMKGYERDEVVGRHFSLFYTGEDLARDHPAEELRLAVRDGRYEEEGWRVRKDGTLFWANVVITAIYEDGELVGFGKVSRDLTARRLAEEELRARTAELEAANRQLAEYRRLVSSVRDYAIFMLDPAGHIRSWNAGAERLKGYTREQAVGRHFSIFYTPADRAVDHPAHELRLAQRDGRYEEEGWRVRKDGSTFWASVTITAVHDDEGRLAGFAKVTRDLTERKRSEDALRGAVEELRRANEDLDRFATIAAHDIADPLRTISGFAELLERADLPPLERERAAHIQATSDRLSRMLRDLLTYARAGDDALPAEPVDVAHTAGLVLADLAGPVGEAGAEVTVAVPESAHVLADGGDVRLVLQNLVANALKYGDPERPSVTIAAEPDGAEFWRVVVADNGPGVDDAVRERVFEAFGRGHVGSRHAGNGLGLAIARRLVDRHGGTIGVEPATGQGSRFYFRLPAAA